MPSKNQQSSNWELSKSFQFSIARALGTFKKFATLTLAVAMLWSCNKEGDVRVTCSNNLTELDCTDQSFHIDTTKSGRKVLLIGIDGFRPDGIHADIAPNLFRLANSDSSFYTNEHIVEDLTFSGPNWSSILNGVHWCKHRVQDNDYSSHELARFPHFFYYLENALDSVNTASISHWLPINEHVAAPYGDYVPMDSWNDADIFAQATDLISNAVPLAPDVVFLQFDELDAAGHN